MRVSRGHKTQNPALYLFRVTGFCALRNHFSPIFPVLGLEKELVSRILINAVYTKLFCKSMKRGRFKDTSKRRNDKSSRQDLGFRADEDLQDIFVGLRMSQKK